jgi:hypothetical protein
VSVLHCDSCGTARDTDYEPAGFVVFNGVDGFLCEQCLDGHVHASLAQIDRCDAAYEEGQYADDFYFTNGRSKVNRATRAAHVTKLEGLGYA